MMSEQDSEVGNFLAGFVIGGLVGAAVALLMAPQSGEETRATIMEKSIELKDKAVVSAEEARTRAEKAMEDARMRAEESVEELRMRIDELAQVTKERASDLQQRGQAVLDDQKARLGGVKESVEKAVESAAQEISGEGGEG
jgi:gas vesicle protein